MIIISTSLPDLISAQRYLPASQDEATRKKPVSLPINLLYVALF